jgi:hypothetical protein
MPQRYFVSQNFSNEFFLPRRTSVPKKDIYYPAEPIEAECRVTGMPVPTVEWVHNSGSMHVSFLRQFASESNLNWKSPTAEQRLRDEFNHGAKPLGYRHGGGAINHQATSREARNKSHIHVRWQVWREHRQSIE